MKNEFFLKFDNGLPRTTAQEKGETIKYKRVRTQKGVKLMPYIAHFRKPEVEAVRTLFAYKLKPFRPKKPSNMPIKLEIILYFNIKDSSKWGRYKTTKPDAENFCKELIDVMTILRFWEDDAQVVDLHIVKYFAEQATIFIRWEELSDAKQGNNV